MSDSSDNLGRVELCVQFADFDGTPNLIRDVPLAYVPRQGDQLNLSKEGMAYFLFVEDIVHHVDCDRFLHTITINGELKRSYAKTI